MNGITISNNDFLSISEDNQLIIEDLKRLLLTIPGERAGNTEFGSRLKLYLFENGDKFDNNFAKIIKQDVERWIPVLEVLKLYISFKDENILLLNFVILNNDTNEAFDYDLSITY